MKSRAMTDRNLEKVVWFDEKGRCWETENVNQSLMLMIMMMTVSYTHLDRRRKRPFTHSCVKRTCRRANTQSAI